MGCGVPLLDSALSRGTVALSEVVILVATDLRE